MSVSVGVVFVVYFCQTWFIRLSVWGCPSSIIICWILVHTAHSVSLLYTVFDPLYTWL